MATVSAETFGYRFLEGKENKIRSLSADHILDLTLDSTGVVWLDLILCMNWNSSSMMWDPRDFNNLTYTAFFSQFIWTPILDVHETIIPQSAFSATSYWKFRMAVVT